MTLAIFQSIGPPELIIVLVIVLVIFGPKRLPALGRQLGTGMKEFKDSITSRGSDDDDDDDDVSGGKRQEANSALGRPEDEPAPVEGDVVPDRTR